MDTVNLRQKDILRRIDRAREAYPALWRDTVRQWAQGGPTNSLWLTYAANYLLNTDGVRWALDPYSLSYRLKGLPKPDYVQDFKNCGLIVLTHAHNDHLDLDLVRALRNQPLRWVIPQAMLPFVLQRVSLPPERIVTAEHGRPLQFDGLTLTAFQGLHLTPGHGVPASGYLAEFGGRRWLFPGDTRVYDLEQLPTFGRLDGVFAHLWLGRGGALLDPPPLLEPFCRFFAGFETERLVVTHLHELGREAEDYWGEEHYRAVQVRLAQIAPDLQVTSVTYGERVDLG